MSCTGVSVSLEDPRDWVDRLECMDGCGRRGRWTHGCMSKSAVGGHMDAWEDWQLADAWRAEMVDTP